MNQLELVNESLILWSTYFHFIYSDGLLLTTHPKLDDLVKDTVKTEEVASGHAFLLGLIVMVNVLAMLVVQIKILHQKAKLRYLRRQYLKKMESQKVI